MGNATGETLQDSRAIMTDKSKCEHMNFVADIEVYRGTDDEGGPATRFSAEISVKCDDCKLPFSFLGVPFGMVLTRPTSSVPGTELRAPIQPGLNTKEQVEHILTAHGGLTYEV